PTIVRNASGFYVRRVRENGTTGEETAAGSEEAPHRDESERKREGVGEKPQKKKRRIPLLPYDAPDRTQIPRRSWLYGFHYMRRIVSATVGPGGIGKSSLGLIEGVGMSTGRDLFGKEELEGAATALVSQ